jgi:peptidyl-prolyl cis-trans isomerase D
MLPLFRSKKEWLKWTLLLVIVALGFTTVLLFVRTPAGITSGVGAQEVARVAGHAVSVYEFRRQYQRMIELYRQLYNLDRQGPEVLKQLGLGQQALNQLINQYAGLYEAEQLGLTVSDSELIEEIQNMAAFQQDGRFIGMEQYRRILQANNLTVTQFEDAMRRDILNDKLRNILTDGISATTDEVRRDFLDQNQEVKLRYVLFDPEEMDLGDPSDEDLKAYYEEKQEDFREAEKRKIKYLTVYVKPTDVEVTDEEIEAASTDVPDQEQVRARHILIRVEEDEAESARKAEDLLAQLRRGADFAELAREHSDDTSAAKGGDLGFFTRGQMVPEFEQAAFALGEGEISGLVRTPFGFHIIQTLEKTTGSGQQRSVAEFQARSAKAERLSSELADEIAVEVRGGKSLEEVAQERSLEVQESDFFERATGIPGMAVGQPFMERVFSLNRGEVIGPEATAGQYQIAELVDVVAARIPEFEEVRENVAELYQEERGRDMARETAQAFRDELREASSFEDLAKSKRLSVTTTEFFKKNSTIDDNLRFSPDVHDQAFSMQVGDFSSPIAVAGTSVVFQLVEKSAVDEEKFSREQLDIRDRLTEQKRAQFYTEYVRNVVDELRRTEEIVINQRLLDDLTS